MYNKTMPANKYKNVYAGKRVNDYIASCMDDFEDQIVQENVEKGYKMYRKKLIVKLPTIEGYAIYLKVSRQVLYDWSKVYPEFREAMELIKTKQKQKLVEHGLDGSYNPTIAKLILANNHGMSDKNDVTSDGKPLNSFNDDQINRIAARIAGGSKGDGNTSGKEESN